MQSGDANRWQKTPATYLGLCPPSLQSLLCLGTFTLIQPALLHSLLKPGCLHLLIDSEVETAVNITWRQVFAEIGSGLLLVAALAFFLEHTGESEDEED